MTPINLKGDAKISRKFKTESRSNKIIFVSASNKVTYFCSFEEKRRMQYRLLQLKASFIFNTDHTETNCCKVMHNIMIAICGTGLTASSPWFDFVHLLQF